MNESIALHVKAQFEVQHDSIQINLPDGAIIYRTFGDLHLRLDAQPICTTLSINLDLDEPHEAGEIVDCTLHEDSVVAEYQLAYDTRPDPRDSAVLW